MTRTIQILLSTILLLLLSVMSGCSSQLHKDMTSAHQVIQEDPLNLYVQASKRVLASSNLALDIDSETSILADGETFFKHARQRLACTNIGSDDMRISMEEVLTIGTHTVTLSEQYWDNIGYFTVNGSTFRCSIRAEAFRNRYVPTIPLDASLYRTISLQLADDQTVILFADPITAEHWALPPDAQLVAANGQAILAENSSLVQCKYDIQYTLGGLYFKESIVATYNTTNITPIENPPYHSNAPILQNPDIPRLLEEACGYLMQAHAISAKSTEYMYSEAFGIQRNQNTQLYLFGSDAEQMAMLKTDITLSDQSRGEDVSQSSQTERFQDGVYTIEKSSELPNEQEPITAVQMRTYCQKQIIRSVLLPQYIESATCTRSESRYLLDFTVSEALAELLVSNICHTLYNDAELLTTLTSSYTTDSLRAYLEIDPYTGFPIASGIHYSGAHTIHDTVYRLDYQLDQSYTLPCPESCNIISGSP